MLFFNPSKSLPKALIINPVGVTTKKKIIPITIGPIILPSNIPNLNQSLFKGKSNLELLNPNNKKIPEINKDHILISLLLSNGHNETTKNKIQNTRPKFLFDGSATFFFIQ